MREATDMISRINFLKAKNNLSFILVPNTDDTIPSKSDQECVIIRAYHITNRSSMKSLEHFHFFKSTLVVFGYFTIV